MKCPNCVAWSLVLSTRETAIGLTRRRNCANGHRFTTQEFELSTADQFLRKSIPQQRQRADEKANSTATPAKSPTGPMSSRNAGPIT